VQVISGGMTQSFSGPIPLEQIRDLPVPQLAMALLRHFAFSPDQVNIDNAFKNQAIQGCPRPRLAPRTALGCMGLA
jgi:hypothetical protein